MVDTIKIKIASAVGRQFHNEAVMRPDGGLNLLVDIDGPLSIPVGEFRRIPTPIRLQGNGQTVALLQVMAGLAHGDDSPVGTFLIPSEDEYDAVDVLVANATGASLMIQPNYSLGIMSFMTQATAASDDDGHAEQPFVVEAVYEPQSLDQDSAPSYGSDGAAGMDLRADVAEAFSLAPGERRLVQTGLRLAVPPGFEAQVRPRSGLALKHGVSVTNSPGTIDSDYRGGVGVILHNLGDEAFEVAPGDRIAQLVFAPVMTATLDFRPDLGESVRAAGGFGSTGRS